jgi:hypothetical protein
MNDNEADPVEHPDQLTEPARKGIPLASAFYRAAAMNPNRTDVPLATMIHQIVTAAPTTSGIPRGAVSPPKAVVVRHRQRVRSRSVALRTRRQMIVRRNREAVPWAGRFRRGDLAIRHVLRAGWSPPISNVAQNVIENMVAPLEKLQRMIAEMIRPSWAQALQQMQETIQRLVRAPALDALRRIQEQIAAYAWPALGAAQRIRDEMTGRSNWLMGAFRHTRDWASGFMTYRAKLRQQINSMVDSWNWKLPDITKIVRPIAAIVTIVDSIEWPAWSSVTETIVKLATRAVFWAAVRVREAIIHDENSEEIVRGFMLKALDLFPKGELHVEAAKEALLENAWLKAEPENVKKVLLKRIRELHRNHRLIGDTELGYHRIVSLQTPLGRAGSDNDLVLTLAEALSDPCSVEDLVLGRPEFRDPRIDRVLKKLKPGERKVADLYAVHDGMTWDRAAAAAGQAPAFGERVRRKLIRLGDEFDGRQAGELHVPTTTRLRTRQAFG